MIVSENFEEKYILLRKKENRLYTDEQLKWLPEIEVSHPHYKEWETRKSSCNKLIQHLSNKRTELNILDVGCGNGWLCHHLSKIPGSNVAGIDINKTELNQAKRVFDHVENLEFFMVELTMKESGMKNLTQLYLPLPYSIFLLLITSFLLHFSCYTRKVRSTSLILIFTNHLNLRLHASGLFDYYHSLQFAEMTEYYFHHCVDELNPYNHKIFYNPDLFRNRFIKNKSPFPWICIYA